MFTFMSSKPANRSVLWLDDAPLFQSLAPKRAWRTVGKPRTSVGQSNRSRALNHFRRLELFPSKLPAATAPVMMSAVIEFQKDQLERVAEVEAKE